MTYLLSLEGQGLPPKVVQEGGGLFKVVYHFSAGTAAINQF